MRVELEKIEVAKKEIHYFYLGAADYYRPVYRVFVHPDLITHADNHSFVKLPIKDCEVVKKDSFNMILKPGKNTGFIFEIEAGYRGTAEIVEINTFGHEYESYKYDIYNSERGSTGISAGAFIITPSDKIQVKWERNGRLYGKPAKGVSILYADGRIEQLDRVENLDDIINEIGEEIK